jgi:tetratricopeptide (TPR) repeat protein
MTNAETALRKAMAGAPANVDVKRELADVLVRQGNDSEAVSYYRQVLAAHNANLVTHMKLAAALRRLRRYDEALTECDRVLEGNPFYAPAEVARATILAACGKRGEAREARERARRMRQARPRAASVHLR